MLFAAAHVFTCPAGDKHVRRSNRFPRTFSESPARKVGLSTFSPRSMGGSRGVLLSQSSHDILDHAFKILENIIVEVSPNPEPAILQILVTHLVIFRLIRLDMPAAIYFDNEFGFEANEIHNV
jgi:hypothetical protein